MTEERLALLGLISLIRNEIDLRSYRAIPNVYNRSMLDRNTSVDCCQELETVVNAKDILVLLDVVELGLKNWRSCDEQK